MSRRTAPARPKDTGPHLTAAEAARLVAALDGASDDARRAMVARLAWRPAWAIRSRSGAFAALRAMFGRNTRRD